MADDKEILQKPMGLQLNKEQAALILKSLKALPEAERKTVVYESLIRDVETIVVIWERILKNQKIMLEQRRAQKLKSKSSPRSDPLPSGIPPAQPQAAKQR